MSTPTSPRRWWRPFGRRYASAAAPAGPEGDFIEYREYYVPHECKVPFGHGSMRNSHGLADGSIWRCRKCGSTWEWSNYYSFDWEWFRREDPRRDVFNATHDQLGHPLVALQENRTEAAS
jgi:hypothetical protein